MIPHPEQSLLFSHSFLHWACSCLLPEAASPPEQAADAHDSCCPAPRPPSATERGREGLCTQTRAPHQGGTTLLGWAMSLSLQLQTPLALVLCGVLQLPFDLHVPTRTWHNVATPLLPSPGRSCHDGQPLAGICPCASPGSFSVLRGSSSRAMERGASPLGKDQGLVQGEPCPQRVLGHQPPSSQHC